MLVSMMGEGMELIEESSDGDDDDHADARRQYRFELRASEHKNILKGIAVMSGCVGPQPAL